ncbi:hypothetical protein L1987_69005 [Smallanthus sonchifolius]|uniref:Uncharacterized protein n=1 Tax=Smallanthus sonchifolius TaxID=185202 RepID=A0ACB9B4W7_9ASTR|nr:hypothetical protein L1987_69005 [Smallanthus sonchifolius]
MAKDPGSKTFYFIMLTSVTSCIRHNFKQVPAAPSPESPSSSTSPSAVNNIDPLDNQINLLLNDLNLMEQVLAPIDDNRALGMH